jgi:transcriptional regulator with XRE-family HTH domain
MYGKDQRMEIGRRIQQIRGVRDQRTFAEAVGSVQQTISKYERGEIPRSWLFLARLVEQEGVDLNTLLVGLSTRAREGEEEPSPPYEGNGGREAGREGAVEEERSFAETGNERASARF